MDRRFMGILVGLVVIFIAIFAFTKNSGNNNSGSSTKNNQAQVTNHVLGQGQKGVTLVEYGDYECPVCEVYYLPLKQAVVQLSSDIRFQFSNLPLTSIHPNAFAAARAAEAAGLQNKYWEMHDKLYDNQNNWASSQAPQSIFEDYARQIGLDINKFKQDYASSQVNDAINADLNAFSKTKQTMATPTFFLDGKYVPNSELIDASTGTPSSDKIVKLLQAEIAKKSSTSKQ